MKWILILGAILLAPWSVLGQPPPNPAPPGVVDARCETVPPGIPAAELAHYMCNPHTGEWVERSTLEATPIAVLAQADPAPAPAATPAAADPEPEKPVEVTDLVTGAAGVVDVWKTMGWLAGLIALINLLLSTLRFKPLNDWLTEIDYKWIKPLIATVLGAALGGLSTFETGAGILLSVVAGIVAGLGSVGFHQLIDTLRKRTSKPAEA